MERLVLNSEFKEFKIYVLVMFGIKDFRDYRGKKINQRIDNGLQVV